MGFSQQATWFVSLEDGWAGITPLLFPRALQRYEFTGWVFLKHHPPSREASGRGQADNLYSSYSGKSLKETKEKDALSSEQF